MDSSQEPLNDSTPLGAHLVAGGATFRVYAPAALEVFVCGDFNGFRPLTSGLLVRRGDTWGGFLPGVSDGSQYKFFVRGRGSTGFKRDPRARELNRVAGFSANGVVRDSGTYPWHDDGFQPPAFHDLILYRLHVGTFSGRDDRGNDDRRGRVCTFLDVVDRIESIAELGVSAVELLPVHGSNGSDLYAPEVRYTIPWRDPRLPHYLRRVNALLARRHKAPLGPGILDRPINQLKVMIDLFHVYGIAVVLNVVYHHHSGVAGGDDEGLYSFDRQSTGDHRRSLYFTSHPDGSEGLVFDYANPEVRRFLIDHALTLIREYHVDGFQFDGVAIIDQTGGRRFCSALTDTLHAVAPTHILIAGAVADPGLCTAPTAGGGLGFDAVGSQGLWEAVRGAIEDAAGGANARVRLTPIRDALARSSGVPARWKRVESIETDHEVRDSDSNGGQPRIARLADPSDARSWYARSRSRVATGLLLTAPGIPEIFMGQEFLEDKPWSDHDPGRLIYWDGIDRGSDPAMVNHLRFTRELIALRRHQPALRGEGLHVFHVQEDNRVIAYQRWVEGVGRDVVVVASLKESTFGSYHLGFPRRGRWLEVFNSDVYDHWVNPIVAGNHGGIDVNGGPMHGLPTSASVVIPANGLVVFARDRGD